MLQILMATYVLLYLYFSAIGLLGGGLTGGNSDTILSSNLFFLGCVSVVLPRHYKIFMEASD